jgi:hypothetical protein
MTDPVAAPAPGSPAAADLYQLANSLTSAIQPADTTYSYPAPSVTAPLVATEPDQLAGLGCSALTAVPAARTDCSGWVSWLMSAAARKHYAGAVAFRERFFARDPCRWPRANVWYRYFMDPSSAEHFRVIQFAELLPGDVVVWAFDPFASNATYVDASGDTGHIVVVLAPDAPIIQAAAQPAGTRPLYVGVSDSSSVPHASGGGYVDRREYRGGPACGRLDTPGGVGSGSITFAVDASGQAVQFCFNATDAKNHFHAPGTNGGQPALLAVRPL